MAAKRGSLETRDRLGQEARDLNNLETPVAAERDLQPETHDRLGLETPVAAAGAPFPQRTPRAERRCFLKPFWCQQKVAYIHDTREGASYIKQTSSYMKQTSSYI